MLRTDTMPPHADVTEDALEPGLPICDPHHHWWEYPTSVYRDEHFLEEAGDHRVTHTVFVECLQHYRSTGPQALRPVGETEWVEQRAAERERSGCTTRLAAGIIAAADLTLGDEVEPVLEAQLAASTRVKGVRYVTAWDASEQIRRSHTDPPPGLMLDARFRAGIACLARHGLVYDAWLYHSQFQELEDLAQCVPNLRIVLDHMGGPLGIGPYAGRRDTVFREWRNGLRRLASCPNVSVKLGGRTMTTAGFGWHKRAVPPRSNELAQAMRPYFSECIEIFGPDRCMFESNFPVDRASCSYVTLWNAFKNLTAAYSPGERARLLRETAMEVYDLGDPASN